MTAPPRAGKPVVGVVGAIGAGKSVVCRRLADLGARVLDADRTGHETLRLPAVRDALVEKFGAQILDGQGGVDRQALGRVVFADAEKRRELEAIVHPVMLEVFRKELEGALSDETVPLVVLDAAILIEAGWDVVCDAIVFVDAPRAVRLERVQRTRGWSEEELTRREAAQLPLEVKKKRALAEIVNDGPVEKVHEAVDRLFAEWSTWRRA